MIKLMDRLKNFSLRVKLVGSFLILVFVAMFAVYLVPQIAFRQITNEAIPTLALSSEASVLIKSQQASILGFVSSGDVRDAEEFEMISQALDQLLVDANLHSSNNVVGDERFVDLIRLVELESKLGAAIIRTHVQTLGHLAIMQLVEEEVEDIFLTGDYLVQQEIAASQGQDNRIEALNQILVLQERFDQLSKQLNAMQIEAINYATFADEGDRGRYNSNARALASSLEQLEPTLNGLGPEGVALAKRLVNVTKRIKQSGDIVFVNHEATLDSLETLAQTEAELNNVLAQVQEVTTTTTARNLTIATVTMLLIGILLLLLAAGLGLLLNNVILQPIYQLLEVTQKISGGDLEARAKVEAQDEIGGLAISFNHMVELLQEKSAEVEYQAKRRIDTLEAGARITRKMTGILKIDDLLHYVVDEIHKEFSLYHTHIYLVEAGTGNLIMAYGFGEIGEKLQEMGHFLAPGVGIVGTVASTHEHFVSNNVHDLLSFMHNPLLPYTKSELAVPLRHQDNTLGVLDVQASTPDRFTPSDIALMQSLANQVAVTIENIRLLDEMQKTLNEVERLNRRLMRQGWDESSEHTIHEGYRFIGGNHRSVAPLSDVPMTSMKQAVSKRRLVAEANNRNGKDAELAVPLVLHGQVIGAVAIKKSNTVNWSDEEKEVVQAVANQTSLALEHARLSEEQGRTIIKLREVDRLKSEFLTSMSHELRTPLNSIIGFADILIQGIDGPLSDNAITDITAIHNSGKHLLLLINGLLDLSKIEAGRMELARDALSLADVVSEVAGSSSSLLAKKPYDLHIDIPDKLPSVWADPLRLNQVLLNLISNAIKFTEEGGVFVKARVNKNNLVEIAITDSGIGIPPDKQELIFEHFRQADARTNRKFQGTGMGLAIAKQLTELHGGEMWVESVEGEGSTFSFTMPIATQEQIATSLLEKEE